MPRLLMLETVSAMHSELLVVCWHVLAPYQSYQVLSLATVVLYQSEGPALH